MSSVVTGFAGSAQSSQGADWHSRRGAYAAAAGSARGLIRRLQHRPADVTEQQQQQQRHRSHMPATGDPLHPLRILPEPVQVRDSGTMSSQAVGIWAPSSFISFLVFTSHTIP